MLLKEDSDNRLQESNNAVNFNPQPASSPIFTNKDKFKSNNDDMGSQSISPLQQDTAAPVSNVSAMPSNMMFASLQRSTSDNENLLQKAKSN